MLSMSALNKQSLPFNAHLCLNILVRAALIVYGEFQDRYAEVPFTDVDYRVITDGARYMLQNESPFKRKTYRYTPLLALLVTPNVFLCPWFGKALFSLLDIAVGVLIRQIVLASSSSMSGTRKLSTKDDRMAKWSAYIWLYNPLTMIIATRGNGDCIIGLLVLLTLHFLLKRDNVPFNALVAGAIHGLAIHWRIYPIFFSLAYFLVLAGLHPTRFKWTDLLWVNKNQWLLIGGTLLSFASITLSLYSLYGDQFIYESFLYHFIRKDIKHNFSLFFYMQYLTGDDHIGLVQKILTILPQMIVLCAIALKFGRTRRTLSFCVFAQSFIIVIYNSVMTSQYFVWFLAILPVCIDHLRSIGLRSAIICAGLWLLAQGGWLLPAYLLEFKGWNTFEFIWLQSIVFFIVNVFIIQRLIFNYNPGGDMIKKKS